MLKNLSRIALVLCLLIRGACYAADSVIINEYDANGNLVTGDGRYYEYNDANQLSKVHQGDQTGPVIAEYFYDSSGQRVKKIENGIVTYYVGKHFEKQVGGENAGSTSYYFGEDGERIAKKDPAGKIFYYHLDHLDGVNVVTDSTGAVVARNEYLPFGELRNGSSNSEKYSYTGKEKDKTDLYYFEARYNSPQFRHFTQPDIAEPDYDDPQDLNRYAYVGNNPMSYVDYDGFKRKHHSKAAKKRLARERAKANALKKAKKKAEERQRAKANAQKKANKREKEKQRAAANYAKHHPASTVQVGAGYTLAVSNKGGGNNGVLGSIATSSNGRVLGDSTQRDNLLQPIVSFGALATKAVKLEEWVTQESYGGTALEITGTAVDLYASYKENQRLAESSQVAPTFATERGLVSGLLSLLLSVGTGGKANSLSGGAVKSKSMGILDKAVFNRAQEICIAAGEDADCLAPVR